MQPTNETYILYTVLFSFLLLRLLFNVVKHLGSSKNFKHVKKKYCESQPTIQF
jgi:hypothetical protein